MRLKPEDPIDALHERLRQASRARREFLAIGKPDMARLADTQIDMLLELLYDLTHPVAA